MAEASEQDGSLPSAGYPLEKLTVRTAASGARIRNILKGKLATGESIETHETTLPPGGMPPGGLPGGVGGPPKPGATPFPPGGRPGRP